eukprot:scaffold3.g6565.t1
MIATRALAVTAVGARLAPAPCRRTVRPAARPAPSRLPAVANSAAEDATGADLPSLLSLAAFAATQISKQTSLGINISACAIASALAWYTFAHGGLTIVQNKFDSFDRIGSLRLPTFQYSTPAWVATLAVAVWQGYAAEWTVAAFGLASAWRLVEGLRAGSKPLLEVPLVALAAYAVWQKAYTPAALAIFAGHIAAAAAIRVVGLANSLKS